MSKLQKFNLIYITGLWAIVLSGFTIIYLSPARGNIIFWFVLFLIWTYSYRPVVNRFFYTKMMDELASKLGKLDKALEKLDVLKKKSQDKTSE